MARQVYGDSYGQVFQNELGLDAARDARVNNAMADQRYRQQQADLVGQQQASLQQQQDQMAQSAAAQQAALMQQMGFHADETDYRNRSLNQQASLNLADLASREKIANMANTETNKRLDLGTGNQLYSEAFQAITNGLVKTPDHLKALVGTNLTPDQNNRLGIYLAQAHERRVKAYNDQVTAANNLGLEYARQVGPFEAGAADAQKKIAAAPLAADKHWYMPSTYGPSREDLTAAPPMALRSYNDAMDKFNTTLGKDKRLGGMVSQDVGTHQFVPAMDVPEDFPGSTATIATLNQGSRAAMPPTPATPQVVAPGAATSPQMPLTPVSDKWVPVQGTNIVIHPAVQEDILTKVNALPMLPNETVTAYRGRQHQYSVQLTQQALASNTARVNQPVSAPMELGPFDGPNTMGNY